MVGVLIVFLYGVKNLLRNEIVLFIVNFLNFKLYVSINWKICFWLIFMLFLKIMVEVVIVMIIFFLILVIYFLYSGLNKLCKCRLIFLLVGFYFGVVLEIVLLGYLVVIGIIVRLLYCVSI